MPNNKNTDSTTVNFAAGHDQASIEKQRALEYQELQKGDKTLELQEKKLSSFDLKTKDIEELQKIREEIAEERTEAINLVKYAQQRVTDLHESAKKLNAIHQTSPEEKLKKAQQLAKQLPNYKPLDEDGRYKVKKIEAALCNTCIIKSAGDETIKFQLGVLGNARENNTISESEFNHLVVLRLKENNLLDSYRLRIEGDMILEQTSLEICLAIDNKLSADPDYKDSNVFFAMRLKGIKHELSLKKEKELEHRLQEGQVRDLTPLWKELKTSDEAIQNSNDNLEVPLNLPEVATTPLPDPSLQQALYAEALKIPYLEEVEKKEPKKSEFVELMQELVPENRKHEIHVDSIQPIPVEKLMKITLERPSPVSEDEKFRLDQSHILKKEEIVGKAKHEMNEKLKDSYKSNLGFICKEMDQSLSNRDKDYSEKSKETKPCQLEGKELFDAYYEHGKRYLENKEQKIKTRIHDLEHNKEKHYYEFSTTTLESKYGHLTSRKKEEKRAEIYKEEKTKLDTQLEKSKKQKALWEGDKTFIQSVLNEKKGKKKELAFATEELKSRKLVLNYNPEREPENQKLNVYQDGVYLVSIKKTNKAIESVVPSGSASGINTVAVQPELSANRLPCKEQFNALSSYSFYAAKSGSNQVDEEKEKQLKYGIKSYA